LKEFLLRWQMQKSSPDFSWNSLRLLSPTKLASSAISAGLVRYAVDLSSFFLDRIYNWVKISTTYGIQTTFCNTRFSA